MVRHIVWFHFELTVTFIINHIYVSVHGLISVISLQYLFHHFQRYHKKKRIYYLKCHKYCTYVAHQMAVKSSLSRVCWSVVKGSAWFQRTMLFASILDEVFSLKNNLHFIKSLQLYATFMEVNILFYFSVSFLISRCMMAKTINYTTRVKD